MVRTELLLYRKIVVLAGPEPPEWAKQYSSWSAFMDQGSWVFRPIKSPPREATTLFAGLDLAKLDVPIVTVDFPKFLKKWDNYSIDETLAILSWRQSQPKGRKKRKTLMQQQFPPRVTDLRKALTKYPRCEVPDSVVPFSVFDIPVPKSRDNREDRQKFSSTSGIVAFGKDITNQHVEVACHAGLVLAKSGQKIWEFWPTSTADFKSTPPRYTWLQNKLLLLLQVGITVRTISNGAILIGVWYFHCGPARRLSQWFALGDASGVTASEKKQVRAEVLKILK